MSSVGELLREGTERLRTSGSETPRLDAELLLAHALDTDRTAILAHPEAVVGTGPASAFEVLLGRRSAGEPVAYLRGFKEFYGMAIAVDRRALIPRPETELLVELAEAEVVDRLTGAPRPRGTPPLRVVDVGCGTGAVAIALAGQLRRRGMLPEVRFLLIDHAPEALQLARENAVGHGLADRMGFVEFDLLPPAGGPWDIVVANLPYVPSQEIAGLPIAASFEPRSALDGGPDGLAVIRGLLAQLPGSLAPDGVALLEFGAGQGPAIRAASDELLPAWSCELLADLAGRLRVCRIRRGG